MSVVSFIPNAMNGKSGNHPGFFTVDVSSLLKQDYYKETYTKRATGIPGLLQEMFQCRDPIYRSCEYLKRLGVVDCEKRYGYSISEIPGQQNSKCRVPFNEYMLLCLAQNDSFLDYRQYSEDVCQAILHWWAEKMYTKYDFPFNAHKYQDRWEREGPKTPFNSQDKGFLVGMPDYYIPLPIGQWQVGLYIELKRFGCVSANRKQYECGLSLATGLRCVLYTNDILIACAVLEWWLVKASFYRLCIPVQFPSSNDVCMFWRRIENRGVDAEQHDTPLRKRIKATQYSR